MPHYSRPCAGFSVKDDEKKSVAFFVILKVWFLWHKQII